MRITSFGSLSHFKKSAKPHEAGSAVRCLDCTIQDTCPYSAKTGKYLNTVTMPHYVYFGQTKVYLHSTRMGHVGWPIAPLVDGIPDIENVTEALHDGPYGRFVYECSNDVADHQVVNIEFSNGATVSFTMVAFTEAICERQLRLHFTHGELIGDMNTFTFSKFHSKTGERTTTRRPINEGGGHGGGDLGLIKCFVEAVEKQDQSVLGTDAQEVLLSHLTVFAAENARKHGAVILCEDFHNAARERFMSGKCAANIDA